MTFLEAVNRTNSLVDFYSKEKTRLEDNLTKLLLPAGLTFTASMLKDAIDPKYVGAAIFLATFFLVYALLIYYDLCVAERASANAFNLQSDLYAHKDADGSLPLDEVVSPDVSCAYDSVESRVGRRFSVPPSAKPLVATAAGALALIIYRSL